MEWIPGIVIAIFYLIWIRIKNSRQKSNEIRESDPLNILIYSIVIWISFGIINAIKIAYFPNISAFTETIFNTCLVLLILFAKKLFSFLRIFV